MATRLSFVRQSWPKGRARGQAPILAGQAGVIPDSPPASTTAGILAKKSLESVTPQVGNRVSPEQADYSKMGRWSAASDKK